MSARARRFFGCVLPFFIALFGCGAMMMAGYAGQVFVQLVEQEDGAMAPLLPAGSRAFVDATAYWADPPRPGRVVYLRTPEGRLLRHLVAGPGETIEIRRGELLRNGLPCDGRSRPEPAFGTNAEADADAATDDSKPETTTCYFRFQGDPADFGPVMLAEDEFFVLAEDSAAADSRTWGPVAREAIFGPALFTVADDFSFDAIATPAPELPDAADPNREDGS